VLARADGDATEIWLDEETRLPLKISHRDRKGEVYDQVATHIEMEKTP
jgi:negative regulator of sigma E activity